jgi:hypothetical protein
MINNKVTVIVRQLNGIGIDSKLNGWNMETGRPIPKKFYNGRVCELFQVILH